MANWASKIALAVLCAGLPIPASGQTNRQPLKLSLECQQKPEPMFRLSIKNVSTVPAAAVIGIVLGNDKHYMLTSLSLAVRRPGIADMILEYVDPSVPAVAGRIDPWLITLPAGASYSLVVPARNFLLHSKPLDKPFAAPAELQLRLTTEKNEPNPDLKALAIIRVWIGTLVSDRLKFPGQCVQ
jgi:hypothetical protein